MKSHTLEHPIIELYFSAAVLRCNLLMTQAPYIGAKKIKIEQIVYCIRHYAHITGY